MTDTFQLSGSYTTVPSRGVPSADPQLAAPISELLALDKKAFATVDLSDDSPTDVALGGLQAAVVVIKPEDSAVVTVALTSVSGLAQQFPVDGIFILISKSNPITDISLTRVPSVATTVKVFLGEMAS